MREVVESSDEDVKAAITKCFIEQLQMCFKKETESLSKEVEDVEKKRIKILEMEITITEVKNSISGLSNRRERAEERICKPKNKTIIVAQVEQRENRQQQQHNTKQKKKTEPQRPVGFQQKTQHSCH